MKNYKAIALTLLALLLMAAILVAIKDETISNLILKFDAQKRVFLFEIKREQNLPQLN
ncbi:hypothetical protein [Crocosphaera sp. XPORK-15E]|uniref:hypothetical protein n=1 Tax=Crocosphaera sp. XPORK-15E TaxID=3110247 RepID=UPI002B212916|nr:hypothetical protein [Crocosphaera sp. XPORK-15E]MEA5535491.1 hypothetical protein [Crocosphaera sp. XPORK-15E]